jgi:hypothetical protein
LLGRMRKPGAMQALEGIKLTRVPRFLHGRSTRYYSVRADAFVCPEFTCEDVGA